MKVKVGVKQHCDWRNDPSWKRFLTERDDAVGDLKRVGISFTEFNLWHPRQKRHFQAEEEVARVLEEATLLIEAGLPVGILHPYAHMDYRGPSYFVGTPDDPVVIYLRMAIESAARIADLQRCEVGLVYHPAEHVLTDEDRAVHPDELRRKLMTRSCDFFQYAQEYIQQLGAPIRLLCETQLPSRPDIVRIGDYPDELLVIAEQSGAGICWDTGHYRLSAEQLGFSVYPETEFLQKVEHVHIHDVKNGKDHHAAEPDSEFLGACIARLRSVGFENSITLEYDYGTEESSGADTLAVIESGVATCRQ